MQSNPTIDPIDGELQYFKTETKLLQCHHTALEQFQDKILATSKQRQSEARALYRFVTEAFLIYPTVGILCVFAFKPRVLRMWDRRVAVPLLRRRYEDRPSEFDLPCLTTPLTRLWDSLRSVSDSLDLKWPLPDKLEVIGRHVLSATLVREFLAASDKEYPIELSVQAEDDNRTSTIKVPLQMGHDLLLFALKREREKKLERET
ncbi:hypothetical protein N3K66_000184 [Trichothecium roseum]|uniref:Uncharacterized protein n=1 Tax=Trichothecium roseum TaxID=47278 RepID=A0ACC0VB51_9HYPO|nr:hypothetical protein N3K66_000184 [Trichothecium roseum]